MTVALYSDAPYEREAHATVVGHTREGGIVLDRTIFYPEGGGQPGDSGRMYWGDTVIDIATSMQAGEGQIALVPANPLPLPPVGTEVLQKLDWARRHAHMRMHTALHLLSVVLPYPVTGGSIGAEKGRLDFDFDDAPGDKAAIEAVLNELVDRDLPVTDRWITYEQLEAIPELVKTLSVKPPRGEGEVRLVQIGTGEEMIDVQACGGTHVARTSEIGLIRVGKIEKKGRRNRRVALHFG